MSVMKVGGFGIGKNHFKTLADALKHSIAGDLIQIKKRKITLDEPIVIPGDIKIVGAPTLITTPEKNVAFWCNEPGEVQLQDLKFKVINQANALRMLPGCDKLTMENVKFFHDKKVVERECFNSLSVEIDPATDKGAVSMKNCFVDLYSIKCRDLIGQDTRLGDAYSRPSYCSCAYSELTDCAIENTAFQNKLDKTSVFSKCVLAANVRLDLKAVVNECTFSRIVLPNEYQVVSKQRKEDYKLNSNVASVWVDGNYSEVEINKMEVKDIPQDAEVYLDDSNFIPGWQALYICNNGHIKVNDSVIENTPNKNRIDSGDLLFKNVNDKSQWVITDARKVHLANRNSVSSLFTKYNAKVSGMKISARPALVQLDNLIGLKDVKAKIRKLASAAKMDAQRQERGIDVDLGKSLHMVFAGNAGTGKTTVAKLYGQALFEAGVLKTPKFVSVTGKDLVAKYVGQTAPKTHEVIMKALDGVLFIDEAYSLAPTSGTSFNNEAVAQLISDMEEYRDRLVVIMAGYSDDMEHFFQVGNEGLRSRFNNWIEFPDYTKREMVQILRYYLKKTKTRFDSKRTLEVIEKGLLILYPMLKKDSGNARFVRNYLQLILENRDNRLAQQDTSKMPAQALLVVVFDDVTPAFAQCRKMLTKTEQQ